MGLASKPKDMDMVVEKKLQTAELNLIKIDYIINCSNHNKIVLLSSYVPFVRMGHELMGRNLGR